MINNYRRKQANIPAWNVKPDSQQVWVDLKKAIAVQPDPVPCTEHIASDIFFSPEEEIQDIAKMFCIGCPVLDLCRNYAEVANEKHGTWGGSSEFDRARDRGELCTSPEPSSTL